MSDPGKAVFLSYASQDAEAAKRIADALRGAGVEVWFDAEGGLEHGDEWDAKIRRQIKECVLFIPIISANTQAREEGYFRIEWELAAQRALGIASGVAFILPILIDGTKDAEALVPDRFRTVQWTKLPGGNVPPEVLQRFLKLWSHRTGAMKGVEAGRPRPAEEESRGGGTPPPSKSGRLVTIGGAIAIVAALGAWFALRPAAPGPASNPKPQIPNAPATPVASEARQLVARARALFEALDCTRDDFKLAEELIAQARAREPMDAEISATEAQLHGRYLSRGWDVSDARREAARAAAQRAIRLDPQSFEARVAQAGLLADTGRDATEKERQLRELRRERPADKRVLRMLAAVLDRAERTDEAAAIADESAALPGGDPVALYSKSLGFWFADRTVEAETAMQASLAQQPFAGARLMSAWYRIALHGDLEGARGYINRIDPAQLIEDRAAFFAFFLEYLAHRPDAAIARLQAVPRDWLNDFWFRGPKGWLVGDALNSAGRHDAAVVEWTAALKLVEQRLAASPNNPALIGNRVGLLIRLGQREEAERHLAVLRQMKGEADISSSGAVAKCHALLGHKEEALKTIAAGLKSRSHAVVFPSGLLRLDPVWDSLRGEPEFTKLIAEAEALEQAPRLAVTESDGAATAPAKADGKSVAVLAFANLSDDKANEYFSDGISEELLNVLAKVPGLKVSARTSAFYFKGKEVPIPEIARQLGVAYVVEGSVRKAGDKVRITAQLIKADGGFHVWSDTFTRDLKDVFAVQDEIAGLIARNLSLKLGTGSPRKAAPVNPEAFELYVQARQAWNLRTAEGFDRAEQMLNRALVLAPDFVRARAALIDVVQMSELRLGDKIGAFGQRNSPELNRLLGLAHDVMAADPELAEIYATLGTTLQAMWRKSEVEPAYRRAVELNPNYATGHHWLGMHLAQVGRMDEALAELKLASELDPLSFIILDNYGWLLNLAGRQNEALRQVDRALALNPGYDQTMRVKASVLAALGRTAEARALAKQVSSRERVLDVFMLADVGLISEAKALLASLDPRSVRSPLIPMLAVGRREDALNSLSDLSGASYGEEIEVIFRPMLDPIRNDPRFVGYLATVGLTEGHALAQAWRAAHPSPKIK